MARCLLALGSNLGDRHLIMSQACAEIAQLSNCHLLARSRWHATVPIGGAADQGEFLNGAVFLETSAPPEALAADLREIENRLGSQRVVRWDARTIDIDMLLYDTEVIETEALVVPHPRMSFRRFVLEPASEIVGSMVHPTSGWTIARLLNHLQDSPRFVVVTSAVEEISDHLVAHLSNQLKCPVWSRAEESLTQACGLLQPGRVEFPELNSSGPPIVARLSADTVVRFAERLATRRDFERPALMIVVDTPDTDTQSASANWMGQLSLGPLARIVTDDPVTIEQEAEAAVRCVWPDLC